MTYLAWSTGPCQADVYLQRSLRKFVIVVCMMIEIQDLEGVQKRCPPKEDQHKKKLWNQLPNEVTN